MHQRRLPPVAVVSALRRDDDLIALKLPRPQRGIQQQPVPRRLVRAWFYTGHGGVQPLPFLHHRLVVLCAHRPGTAVGSRARHQPIHFPIRQQGIVEHGSHAVSRLRLPENVPRLIREQMLHSAQCGTVRIHKGHGPIARGVEIPPRHIFELLRSRPVRRQVHIDFVQPFALHLEQRLRRVPKHHDATVKKIPQQSGHQHLRHRPVHRRPLRPVKSDRVEQHPQVMHRALPPVLTDQKS